MQLIFVRHGVSEDADWMFKHAKSDFERPLTERGAHEIQAVAHGLRKVIASIDYVVASPLVRAQQTAEIISSAYGIGDLHTEEALSHEGMPSEALRSLAAFNDARAIICVGHQPNISATISLALTGSTKPVIDMGRGASCGVHFASQIRAGGGTLMFHIPRQAFL